MIIRYVYEQINKQDKPIALDWDAFVVIAGFVWATPTCIAEKPVIV